nr:unnamed protein product [Callosobruchus analis]
MIWLSSIVDELIYEYDSIMQTRDEIIDIADWWIKNIPCSTNSIGNGDFQLKFFAHTSSLGWYVGKPCQQNNLSKFLSKGLEETQYNIFRNWLESFTKDLSNCYDRNTTSIIWKVLSSQNLTTLLEQFDCGQKIGIYSY